jgi:hypothetical protein
MARLWLQVLLCAASLATANAFCLRAGLVSGHAAQRVGAPVSRSRGVPASARARTAPQRARVRMAGSDVDKVGVSDKEAEERSEALADVMGEEPEEGGGAADAGVDEDDEAADDAGVGSFRQRRAAKKKAAARGGQVSSELRFKLLEEQASPFRRFRQFFYLAAAGSASIGTFIAGTRVIAGMQGISGVQPLEETIPNTAINAGVVVASAALWYFDEKRGQEALSELKGKSSSRCARHCKAI